MLAALFAAGAAQPCFADFTNVLQVGGADRTMIVHVPPSYSGSETVPLLLMFHGLGSSAAAAASQYYDWQSTADTNCFVVVFPESLSPPGKNIEWPPGSGNVVVTNYDGVGKRWDTVQLLRRRLQARQDPRIRRALRGTLFPVGRKHELLLAD